MVDSTLTLLARAQAVSCPLISVPIPSLPVPLVGPDTFAAW